MLEVRGITAGYGESMVLRDVHLTVPTGRVAALMGSNGVGKSTLLKTIMGLIKPKSGEVIYKGRMIGGWTPYQRALAGLGYVPQGRDIFPFLTVRENLILGLEARGLKPSGEMARVLDYFPILKPLLPRLGGDLSGGQQQILALARILLTKPELLILDEPTEGIQPSIVQEIEDAIGRIREEGRLSVLLVEQFVDFALSHADVYYLMEHGELTRSGEVSREKLPEIKSQISI